MSAVQSAKVRDNDDERAVLDLSGPLDWLVRNDDPDPDRVEHRVRAKARRGLYRELDNESEVEQLRSGSDVPGWHVASNERTGGDPGRPNVGIGDELVERFMEEFGISRETFDDMEKRRGPETWTPGEVTLARSSRGGSRRCAGTPVPATGG